ncbi:hypothetical protein NE619_00495 [Anaerovorax odorimutans]|uniref:DUF340 domain-containing protein n=1 Tax=Anaerovorax odorimutans TaxID=109327 RepID=A0ABT1RJ55_9FIRM|nr:hypothetical protein [Anaerovorax odorimutans]MCQ4635211.1 hypothetical protein [Anaerovorax odorimutans]
MKLLVLYLAITFSGYFVGSRLRKSEKSFKWIGVAQLIAIVVLVFTMGGRIGADKSVIASLSSIGLTALVLTVLIFAGSVGAVFAVRKLLGFSREGVKTDD